MRISDWSSDVCSSDLTLYESSAADYGAKEDIYAGYLLVRYEGSALRIIGGVRVERTSNRFTGNRVETIEEGAANGDDRVVVTPVAFEMRYTDWLLSLHLRYEPARTAVLRFAASKSHYHPKHCHPPQRTSPE